MRARGFDNDSDPVPSCFVGGDSGWVVFLISLLALLGVSACGGTPAGSDASPDAAGVLSDGSALTGMTNHEVATLVAGDDPHMQPVDSLFWPASDMSSAPRETEPNDAVEEAMSLEPSRAVQGRAEDRNRDFFSFEVALPPQRWVIEAQGEGVARLTHRSPGGVRTSSRVVPEDPDRHVITNLYLLPGTHYVEVSPSHAGGDYVLRVVPLGAPDPRSEREPNDDFSRAHRLVMGTARQGHLFEAADRDFYYFTVEAETQTLVQFVPPRGIRTRLTLALQTTGTQLSSIMRMDSDTTGATLVYRGRLHPGTYALYVHNERGGSRLPYAVRVDRLDPFAIPIDREPNDVVDEAAALPTDLVVYGHVGEHHRDDDWYRLPVLASESTVTVTPSRDLLHRNRPSSVLAFFTDEGPVRSVAWSAEDSSFTGTLPADTPLFARVRGVGRYRFAFAFDPGPTPQERPALPVTITLPAGPHTVAAYWHEGQRLDIPVTLRYRGEGRQTLHLQAVSGHPAWEPVLADSSLTLGAGDEAVVPLTVSVQPDAWADHPVPITVRVADEQGGWRSARATFRAACGATPVESEQTWPVPDALLGGLNVAAVGLGSAFDSRDALLFDGFTPNDNGWTATLPATVTVELAGDQPVHVAGVLLHPQNGRPLPYRAREFDVAVSLDGTTFTPVLSGTLDRYPMEQAFVLEHPVEARFVRLYIRSSYSGTAGNVNLGEFKVVAMPDAPPNLSRVNLADPALGGHVVWADPVFPSHPVILTEEGDAPQLRLDVLNPTTWVIGFHHGRAARVSELEWVQQAEERERMSFMSKVQVAVSTESPLGPWTPLGTWELDTASGSTSTWTLPRPVWARYVRFVNTEPERLSWWHLPETIRIYEGDADAAYRSMIGEWGHY